MISLHMILRSLTLKCLLRGLFWMRTGCTCPYQNLHVAQPTLHDNVQGLTSPPWASFARLSTSRWQRLFYGQLACSTMFYLVWSKTSLQVVHCACEVCAFCNGNTYHRFLICLWTVYNDQCTLVAGVYYDFDVMCVRMHVNVSHPDDITYDMCDI